ncbi:outer membrane efflux protein [Verrucomicrobiia bacterium DG1235]|nr:outer membrane efflux protein [Verrucomicrobiae bacterium DG1235]
MHKALTTAIAIAALLQSPLRGQDHSHDHTHFDRSTAIAHALEYNKDLIAARLAMQRAEARLQATGIAPNPSLQIEYADDLLFNDEGEGSFGIGISQQFPLAGKLAKQKALTRFDIDLAHLEVRSQELKLAQSIYDFALDIHLVDTRSAHLSQLRNALQETTAFAETKASTGEISPLDARQFKLELRILEQQIESLRIERERLIHQLAPLLGQHSSEHFSFDASNALPYPDNQIPGYTPEVLERIPAYQFALIQEKAAEAKVTLAQAENWDALTASIFWKNEKGVDQPIGRTSDHILGVSFSIPLPLRKKGDLSAHEHRLSRDQSRLNAAAIRFRIQNEIEHARHEATITRSRMEDYRSSVILFAAEQLDQLRQAYQNGQTDMLTLLRAQQQRVSLENGYLEIYEEFAHALVELELARVDIAELQ